LAYSQTLLNLLLGRTKQGKDRKQPAADRKSSLRRAYSIRGLLWPHCTDSLHDRSASAKRQIE